MDLVQSRIVIDDVRRLAAFYASLLDVRVTLNDYYVEVLDFQAADVNAEYPRIDALGVNWVMRPTTQLWGNRTMTFRDPEGVLINVFSREGG